MKGRNLKQKTKDSTMPLKAQADYLDRMYRYLDKIFT